MIKYTACFVLIVVVTTLGLFFYLRNVDVDTVGVSLYNKLKTSISISNNQLGKKIGVEEIDSFKVYVLISKKFCSKCNETFLIDVDSQLCKYSDRVTIITENYSSREIMLLSENLKSAYEYIDLTKVNGLAIDYPMILLVFDNKIVSVNIYVKEDASITLKYLEGLSNILSSDVHCVSVN